MMFYRTEVNLHGVQSWKGYQFHFRFLGKTWLALLIATGKCQCGGWGLPKARSKTRSCCSQGGASTFSSNCTCSVDLSSLSRYVEQILTFWADLHFAQNPAVSHFFQILLMHPNQSMEGYYQSNLHIFAPQHFKSHELRTLARIWSRLRNISLSWFWFCKGNISFFDFAKEIFPWFWFWKGNGDDGGLETMKKD